MEMLLLKFVFAHNLHNKLVKQTKLTAQSSCFQAEIWELSEASAGQ